MKQDYDAQHLNIEAFARSHGTFDSAMPLSECERLLDEAEGSASDKTVHFTARGAVRQDEAGFDHLWLILNGTVALPQTCQRCLGPVDVPVAFQREFRFVATEELAEAQDEVSEEDVLVLSRDFNLRELVEDELLMALPVVPKHDVCPAPVKLQVADPDFVEDTAEKPNSFAILEKLKIRP